MSTANVERVAEVFRAVLELGDRDPRAAVPGEEWNWDSLAHVLLVSGLESEFGVSIDLAASLEIESFDGAVDALEQAGVSFPADGS